jgi:hypothetical protein
MKKRNTPIEKRGTEKGESIPLKYCVLTLICGLLVVVGFFWAARQHFSAMDFGIKNAKLKQQKESLEAELRRLNLAKEIAQSPAEIKKMAKRIGLQDLQTQIVQVVSPAKKDEKPATSAKPVIAKKADEKNQENKVEKPKQQPLTDGSVRPQIAKK